VAKDPVKRHIHSGQWGVPVFVFHILHHSENRFFTNEEKLVRVNLYNSI
jgi:hypothetical protein